MSTAPDNPPTASPSSAPAAPQPAPAPRKPKRLRRWVRRLTLLTTVTVLLLALGLFLVTRPFLLTPILTRQLDGYFDTTLQLDRAHLALDGTLTLTGIAVDTPGNDPTFTRLYEADRIIVNLDLGRLVSGQHPIVAVRPVNPRFYITEDLRSGVFNYEKCSLPEAEEGVEPKPLPALPAIYLSNAQIVLRAIDDTGVKRLETVYVEGELSANTADPNAYGFALRELPSPEDPTPATTVFGQFHTRQLTGNLSVRNFRFNPSQRFLLPAAARGWFDRTAPAGRVPVADITVAPDEEGQIAVQSAAFQTANLTANLAAPGAPSPFQVGGVNGTTRFVNNRIEVADLQASILGLDLTANGTVPLEFDGPGDLVVDLEPFELNWLMRTQLRILHPLVNQLFNELRPAGRFAGQARITRAAQGQPLKVGARLDLLDSSIRHHEFPFPVLNAKGSLRVDDNMVYLDRLVGQSPTGSPITVDGYTDIRRGGPVQISITARNVDKDTHLERAIEPRVRKLVDSLFSVSQYERLLREGVIRHPPIETSAAAFLPARPPLESTSTEPALIGPATHDAYPPAPPNPNAPVFTLGGRADTDIEVFRNRDTQKISTRITISATPGGPGIGFLDERWPYPITARSGRVVIAPGEVRIENIDVVSPTGGTGTIAGRVDINPAPDHDLIDVRLTPLDLPLDPIFYASIPEDQRGWVSDLNIAGRIQGDAEIFTRDAGDTGFRVFARLDNVTAAPHQGRFPIRNVRSRFALTGQRFDLREFTGTHDNARIDINGHAVWAQDPAQLPPGVEPERTRTTWDFTVRGEDVPVSDALLDLIPADLDAHREVANLVDTYNPEGVFSTTIRWVQPDPTPTADWDDSFGSALEDAPPPSVELRPRALSFDYGGDRLTLTDMAGKAIVEPHAVELLELQGNHPHGTLKLHGTLALQPTYTTRITLNGHATRVGAFERAVLPSAVTQLIEEAGLQGAYRLRSCRITASPPATPGPLDEDGDPKRDLSVVAQLAFNDASGDIGIELSHLQAELSFTLDQPADAEFPRITGSFLSPSFRASDRLVERLTANFHTDPDPQQPRLIIPEIRGSLATGLLVGSAALDLEDADNPTDQPGYTVKLYINEADAEPIFTPDVPDRVSQSEIPPLEPYTFTSPPPPDRGLVDGLVSVSLTLVGRFDDPQSKTGRGRLTVREATLYDSPFALAVLQAINLQLPFFAQPFDTADASFLVDGDTVWVNNATLASPSLAIVGVGTMALPGLNLDLQMFMQDPENTQTLTPQFITSIRNQLFGIRVRGTLDDPQASVTPLPNFGSPLPTLPPP
ncbi:MAG: hypothetical protein AAF797_16370 [Planctomycetota bacterium]